MPNNKLILRSVNSPWVSPFNDITTGSVLSWADVDNNFIYLKGEIIHSGHTSGNSLILEKINGNTINLDLEQFGDGGNRWYIPFGTTIEVREDYQSFIYGDLYIEGLLKLNDGAQLVVLNGDIIMSGGSISGNGTTLLVQLPEFDTNVTGATFNPISGVATFINNSGGTFSLSGLAGSEIFVTGGTYNPSSGVATFTNNSGGTFNVNGFLTGYTNYYTTGATLVDNIAYFDRTDVLSAYTLNLSSLEFTGNTSASCITELWVSNIHGCSPITVHNSIQHDTSTVSNETSFAFGDSVIATGTSSHAEGIQTTASSTAAHAEGQNTIASGNFSHAEGIGTIAGGDSSHAEGQSTIASGNFSHAGGINAIASGLNSFIHSSGSTVSGARSVVLGGKNLNGSADDTVYVPNFNSRGNSIFSGSSTGVVTIIGSGSTSPIFTVQGSSGELFSITDTLTGSLFSVNDISGLPVLEAFDSGIVMMGPYTSPYLNTSTRVSAGLGSTDVYSIPTSGYTGAFFEYTVTDGTNLRAGTIMSIWDGVTANYTETATSSIGSTAGITFKVQVSGTNAILRASGTTASWTVKTIVRSI